MSRVLTASSGAVSLAPYRRRSSARTTEVYGRARLLFSDSEIAEAFAATAG